MRSTDHSFKKMSVYEIITSAILGTWFSASHSALHLRNIMISDGIYRVQMQFGRGEHYIPNQTNVIKLRGRYTETIIKK